MDENSFSKISKKLPPVKTGQRFGAKLAQTKKVGLFSERRFLIFTKKGPIEITFKPAHYSAAFLMLVVGFTSIVYWSVIGLSSAIDVAQKDIITEASANFVNKESFDKEISLKSDTSLNEDIESSDVNVKSDFESNITIPNHKKPYFKTNPVFIIKTLNPKPGESYLSEDIQISQPDVIVSKSEKGWKIDLNRSTLPTVRIDEEYIEEMNNLNLDEKSNDFSNEKIGEAKWLKKAVEQRNKTILKVTSEILKKQTGFFKHGFSHMKPMILKDVADAIGMHESTISRVTNSKLILTEWGLLSMKDFFSASIASTEESDKHAASAVREALKKLISSEISGKPLSDEKIADVLSNDGMDVARRTVAKYRDMLNIPSSAQRRRNANFNKLLSNG